MRSRARGQEIQDQPIDILDPAPEKPANKRGRKKVLTISGIGGPRANHPGI
jgi:hypothetical protein